jgi:hypothetical protein
MDVRQLEQIDRVIALSVRIAALDQLKGGFGNSIGSARRICFVMERERDEILHAVAKTVN